MCIRGSTGETPHSAEMFKTGYKNHSTSYYNIRSNSTSKVELEKENEYDFLPQVFDNGL